MFMDICSMHILIIAATHHEIGPTANFYSGKKNDRAENTIETIVTGVGLVSTTYFLTKYINRARPDIIIQAGIAGCFQLGKNNTIFAVQRDIISDLGVTENNIFKDIFDLNLAGKNDSPFKDGWLTNPYRELLSAGGFEQVNAVSVNESTTDANRTDWYQQKYQPVVESMEGAALHYVCLLEKIPFLQIRAVSNYIGERDKAKWSIKEAIAILNENLLSLIKKISTQDETFFRI